MAIQIQNRQRTVTIDIPRLQQRIQMILDYLAYADSELSLVFANDRFLHVLNRTYRHKDRPTNVLAFPQLPMPSTVRTAPLLGDVVISVPTAAREARKLGQTVEERVLYLALHGILHLLGYEHEQSAAERQRMETLEQMVLTHLRRHTHA